MPGSEFEPRSPLQTETGHPIWVSCFFNRPEELAVSTRARSAHKSSGGWQEFTTFQSRKKIKHNHNTPPPVSSRNGWGVRLKSPDFAKCLGFPYFLLSATATATATVAPTMGLLPMPRKPIISTEETAFGGFLIGAQGFQKK